MGTSLAKVWSRDAILWRTVTAGARVQEPRLPQLYPGRLEAIHVCLLDVRWPGWPAAPYDERRNQWTPQEVVAGRLPGKGRRWPMV